jgi:rRNA maturation RNase YbeY
LNVIFDYSDIKERLKIPVQFRRIVREIEVNEDKKLGEICYIFVSRRKILEINRSFLKHDYVTDVVTFNLNKKGMISGDIYICADKVSENACRLGIPLEEEISRVMIHGILHLIGYNDLNKLEQGEMRKKEDFYLAIIEKKGL